MNHSNFALHIRRMHLAQNVGEMPTVFKFKVDETLGDQILSVLKPVKVSYSHEMVGKAGWLEHDSQLIWQGLHIGCSKFVLHNAAIIWWGLCASLTIPRCVLKEPVASPTVVHKNHQCQGKPRDITVGKALWYAMPRQ